MRTLNPNTLERVENYITEYQKKNGKSPSYRQIMHGVGMSSLNLVQRYVLALEREGRIERTRIGNISVPPKLKPSGVAIAPLVGSIACGQPVDAAKQAVLPGVRVNAGDRDARTRIADAAQKAIRHANHRLNPRLV